MGIPCKKLWDATAGACIELREINVVAGQQGIWRHREVTKDVSPDEAGVTVSVMHKLGRYSDELTDAGIEYHYPVTQRPGKTDEGEITATKHAGELGLPVFVVTDGSGEARTVQLGSIRGANDNTQRFFIEFLDEWPAHLIPISPPHLAQNAPLELKPQLRSSSGTNRNPQRRQLFRFNVIAFYGAKRMVCDVAIPALLEASRLIPIMEHGTDDPRNGLVLCPNHRKAFDLGFFAIEPANLSIRFRMGSDGPALGITATSIADLAEKPHPDALAWHFRRWERT